MILGPTGVGWWRWAWRTPQSAGWNAGHAWTVARRAQLEDIWATQVADGDPQMPTANAIRELDDRLGLTPKGMAALRWEIADDSPVDDTGAETDEVARRRADRQRRLTGS